MAELDIDAAELFHLNSSHVRATPAQMPPDPEHKPSVRRLHPGARRIALGGADLDVPLPLGAALAARRSIRASPSAKRSWNRRTSVRISPVR